MCLGFKSKNLRRIEKIYPVDGDAPYLRVYFSSGENIIVPVGKFPRLSGATHEQRLSYRIFAGGRAVSWADLDEDIHVSGLLRAAFEDELEAEDA